MKPIGHVVATMVALLTASLSGYASVASAAEPATKPTTKATANDMATAARLIHEANELLKRHRNSDAIARVKAAVASAQTSHAPWRALEQVTGITGDPVQALKCWDDMLAQYPSNAFARAFHDKVFYANGRLEASKFDAGLKAAKALAPTDPFILFYSVQALTELGQYDSALQDISVFRKAGGDEGVNEAIGIYEVLGKALNRQLSGTDLPPNDWAIPEKYEIDLEFTRLAGPLLMQLDLKSPDFILGGGKASDFQPKRWKLGGSKEEPASYAPGLFMWDATIIAVPRYGTLVVNGSHLKYVQTRNGVTTSRYGIVKGWRFQFDGVAPATTRP